MKTVVEGLNTKLEQLERKVPQLEKNPMPDKLIAEAEEYSPPEKKKEPEAEIRLGERTKPSELAEEKKEYLEKKREKEFRRRERKAAEKALEKVLNSRRQGMKVEELEQQLKDKGFSEGVVKASVERLQNENQVKVKENKILSKGAARADNGAYPNDKTHSFFVEKVYQGNAVVEVDGKWRAVLAPEDYEGPRHLVKKGKKFQAVADLYKEDGKFRAWVKDIVGK